MRIATIPAIAASAAVLVVTAAPAHADDQSYLNYLTAHGQSTTAWPMSPAQFVILGHGICTNLHAGADPLAGTSPIRRVNGVRQLSTPPSTNCARTRCTDGGIGPILMNALTIPVTLASTLMLGACGLAFASAAPSEAGTAPIPRSGPCDLADYA